MRFFTSFRMTKTAFSSLRHSLQGEREVRLRSDDKIFCRIRVKSPDLRLQAMRAAGYVFKRSSGTHFPICCLSCERPARATKTLFADGAYLAAYLAARRDDRVYVRVGSAGANGGGDRSKVTSIELLRWDRPGYDVCGRDPASHSALLRALRRKAGRIRI